MVLTCDEYPQHPNCHCFNTDGESVPQYKQHNSSGNNIGLGFSCCNRLHHQPSKVSNIRPYDKKRFQDVYEYLETMQPSETLCDYSKYYGNKTGSEASVHIENNFPELYEHVEKNIEIFNNYYSIESFKPYGIYNTLTDNRDLIPIITDNNITCPVNNFIPKILSYQESYKNNKEYLYICFPKNIGYFDLSFPYSIHPVLNTSGNVGKNSSIDTKYHPTMSVTMGKAEHTTRKNNLPDFVIAIIIIFSLVVAFLLITNYHKNRFNMIN